TILVSSSGPSTATSVQVSDSLPTGLTFVGATPSQGSYDATTGIWTVGTLAAGAIQTLTLQASVGSAATGGATNTATVSSATFDPTSANNSASTTVTAQSADLGVTKTVDNATPPARRSADLTMLVSSGGPSTATSVQVSDSLPTGLTFVAATASQGSYDPTT